MVMIAEQAFIGTILKENHLFQDTIIKPIHLQDSRHRVLMTLFQKLVMKGQSFHHVTLSIAANPDSFGGLSYLNELMTYADPVKFDEYEQILIDAWKEREKRNILTLSLKEDWEINNVIQSLDEMNEISIDDHKSILDELVDMYELPYNPSPPKTGVLTGINDLDIATNGWQDGEVTIIAARPSMGKTDFMLHLAKEAGFQHHLPLIFSLEMPTRSLTNRLIASTGGYHRSKMRDLYRLLTPEQKKRWTKVLEKVSETNIQIHDKSGQTVPMIRAKVRKAIHKYPDKKPIIFIDYLGLIQSNEFYGGNLNLQIGEISRNLKAMAKEFHCPVICLSQLNRSVEQRQDKRPQLGDIRDSGCIEQDADVILFLYREKYYDKTLNNYHLEIIIAKNRNGPIGSVHAKYNENTGEIRNDDSYDQRVV